ncbi:hypothetical protein Pmar_PMAR013071 [Perkinsus marinus ATCC 50983]|uniref:Uncharacterized protein n=1 Tax=Perkinsus marinus (strain ATCC 50983 / TXsc) TaxID=423536 RepID=C5KUR8_PERM5|nr:hypothetical protein Pmar_PMAR013071 [Perkinsus marinus ATCC 50983]EER11789.1 hypothetical protein Pmar_PMAR013071 [Perkinsus marinus ATCC 50983]|eukprot:XP_002779994.1 hypothetical protein Pmar_PMAR013071 [Perkinsus marinus ATCC 50983]
MTDVNGEATTLAVGEHIRESIDQAETTLLDYKGRRSVAEKWVDFVDNSKWLSSFLIDAKHVSPPCEVPGLIFIISAVLRGFGQVVFQDNPWTGLFVCIAGGLPHWPTAIMGIIGYWSLVAYTVLMEFCWAGDTQPLTTTYNRLIHILTAILHVVLPNGGPALTAPFCITVTILLGAMLWDFIDGVVHLSKIIDKLSLLSKFPQKRRQTNR